VKFIFNVLKALYKGMLFWFLFFVGVILFASIFMSWTGCIIFVIVAIVIMNYESDA